MKAREALALYYQELERRAKKTSPLELIDESFEKQAAFLNDPAKLKAAICTRRAGKSYGGATLLFKVALSRPGVSVLYVALSRDSAKKIMWKDCIKTINRKHNLECKFNETELTATLPNGSIIYLTGADAKPDEMEKLLGQKYALCVIDECASFKNDMKSLVYKVLKPAVADYQGTIAMIGTPSNVTSGLFYEVTTGKEPGWSVHSWSAFDNPYMRDNWNAEIEGLKVMNPLVVETPWFRQMYMGEWFIETDKLVYRYDKTKNVVQELPNDQFHYVLGVDLGYDPDPSAFVVAAYSEHDPNLYFIETYKQTKLILSDVAERIRHYQKKYPYIKIIVDCAAKQAVEEMKQRYQLPLVAAEKHGKAGFIEIMNSDFIMGQIKCVEDQCLELIDEWQKLVWDEKSTKREENPSCANHLTDASLYAWRWAYNYAWRERPKKTNPFSEAAIDQFWEQESERVQHKKHRSTEDEYEY
jgi:phage terminase large subunit